MYEVWYTEDGISSVVLFTTFEHAVESAVSMVLDSQVKFEYIVGPQGEIRNDFVSAMAEREQRKRKEKKTKDDGKPWLIEVRDQYRDDVWGIAGEKPNEQSANGILAELAEKLGEDRVRVRFLPPEG